MSNLLDLENEHPWNVISEANFKTRMKEIFDLLAYTVGKTAGPYGAATMLEELGTYHMTKDGFTVLKNIHFNNRTDNTILNLILTISHQMVMKVGDGSTTAILAAHEFIEELSQSEIMKEVRPKDFSAIIQKYIDLLSKEIQGNSIQISDENFVEVMTNIARIATNDNEEYTSFIHDIYKLSGRDTTISKRMSPTDKADFRIMDDMFYISGRYMDKVYCNAENGAKCNINNPLILLFNFTLGNEHWDMIKLALNYMMAKFPSRRMVVIAPNYDQYFVDHIKNDVINFTTAYQEKSDGGAIPFPMVFARNPFFKSAEKMIYEDLAPFLGNVIINPLTADEIGKQILEYYKVASTYNRAQSDYQMQLEQCQKLHLDPKEIKITIPDDDGTGLRAELEAKMGSMMGSCDHISIGQDTIEFTGFSNKNQNMIDIHILDAKDQLQKELDEIENLRYVNKQYLDAKERLSRIACRSAMIYVGGNSDLEKKMNDDALDDAIRACQSANTYGYNLGNNLAIIKALEAVSPDTGNEALDNELKKLMRDSFYKVLLTIHQNKNADTTLEQVKDIVKRAIECNKCYDLNTEEFNENIINSCRTDIEILKGALSIVALILSANQYVSVEVRSGNK